MDAVGDIRRLLAEASEDVQRMAAEALEPAAQQLRTDLRASARGSASRATSTYPAIYGRLAERLTVEADTFGRAGTYGQRGFVVKISKTAGRLEPGGYPLGTAGWAYEYGARGGDLVQQQRGDTAADSGWRRAYKSTRGRSTAVRAGDVDSYTARAQAQYVKTETRTYVDKRGRTRTRKVRSTVEAAEVEAYGQMPASSTTYEQVRVRKVTDAHVRQFPPRTQSGWWVGPTLNRASQQLAQTYARTLVALLDRVM